MASSGSEDAAMSSRSSESIPMSVLASCCCQPCRSSPTEGMAASDEELHLMMKNKTGAGGANKKKQQVGILGTGDFARALSKRLVCAGYDVLMGSRSPQRRQLSTFSHCLCGVKVVSLDECIDQCPLLISAIHMENFKATLEPRGSLLAGKVVVDVSNRANRYSAVSNAEFLQSLVPDALVVKAFNSLSAYALEEQASVGVSRVFVASDHPGARERVMDLARDLGFAPSDMGGLRAARNMEAFVLKVFPGWKLPLFFTFGVFNLWALYCVYIYFIERTAYRWDQIFLKVLNKPVCMTAVTLLALTYLAGSVAGVVQLWRGTKYRAFPRWLNAWMVSRRQLGLTALVLALVHALASAMMLSPTYYSSWFTKPSIVMPQGNFTAGTVLTLQPAWMVWKGELSCLLGLAALVLLVMVGVASLPSVSAVLNWAEWRLVQSRVGVLALFLALAHVLAMGAPGWAQGGWAKTYKSITFLSGLLPALTVILRVVLALPPCSHQLKKIRTGWERSSNADANSNANSIAIAIARASSEDDNDEEEEEEDDQLRQSGPGGGGSSNKKKKLQACCSPPRKGILKTSNSCMSKSASSSERGLTAKSQSTAYTALNMDAGADNAGCGSCQIENVHPSLPTRGCDCSVV